VLKAVRVSSAETERAINKDDLAALRIDHDARGESGGRRWPWVVGTLIVLALGAAGTAWMLRGPAVAEVRTAPVRQTGGAAGAGGGTVLNASGYVVARRRATVSSKITGKLVDTRVEEGMPVAAGQFLARLDDTQYRARLRLSESQFDAARGAVAETEARLELARITLARTRRLVDEGVTGQADLDADRTEVEALDARLAVERQQAQVAEREVELRRAELADTVIEAPFAGIVVSKDAQPGEMVSPVSAGGGFTRTGICTIVDMGSLEIEIDVNESYISRVSPDQPVEATLDAYSNWKIPAHVIAIIPTADRQKATVRVRVAIDVEDPRILPDMGAKVAFQERAADGEVARAELLVPDRAVRRVEGREIVWVVDEGRVQRRAVSLGAKLSGEIVVLSGVSAGERVIVEGPAELADGDPVKETDR
jgi:RND family efflux transporter MFP subunit